MHALVFLGNEEARIWEVVKHSLDKGRNYWIRKFSIPMFAVAYFGRIMITIRG